VPRLPNGPRSLKPRQAAAQLHEAISDTGGADMETRCQTWSPGGRHGISKARAVGSTKYCKIRGNGWNALQGGPRQLKNISDTCAFYVLSSFHMFWSLWLGRASAGKGIRG